jgi:hypothetical protein
MELAWLDLASVVADGTGCWHGISAVTALHFAPSDRGLRELRAIMEHVRA